MNNSKRFLSVFALLATALIPAFAQQNQLLFTTTAAAVTSDATTVVNLTATTGLVASPGGTSGIYCGTEYMTIRLINGLFVSVARGQAGTDAANHPSGELCWLVPSNNLVSSKRGGSKAGACTRASEYVIPFIDIVGGDVYDCLGGQWVKGQRVVNPAFHITVPSPGGTAYTSIGGTGTATIATEVYCTEVNLPYNKLLTGMALLAGTANSTDKHYVILYDSAGKVLANSTTAGTSGNTTASAYQQYAFTSQFYAVGPAQYFGCFQSNGTTDTVRMIATGTNDSFLTKGQTGATFGTIPALTVPTTFTTAVGPYLYLY